VFESITAKPFTIYVSASSGALLSYRPVGLKVQWIDVLVG